MLSVLVVIVYMHVKVQKYNYLYFFTANIKFLLKKTTPKCFNKDNFARCNSVVNANCTDFIQYIFIFTIENIYAS